MPFVSSFKAKDKGVPARCYVHSVGLEQLFGFHSNISAVQMAERYFRNEVLPNRVPTVFDYIIAVIWGDVREKVKIVDFFGYFDLRDWSRNPDVIIYSYRDSQLSETALCGDTLVLLGLEELYRRTTKSLGEYFEKDPKLPVSIFHES